MMADRNQTNRNSDAKSAPRSKQGESGDAGRDDDLQKNPDPDSERSGASRPRGQTEEPDRTL
jgi:hypothetical protein